MAGICVVNPNLIMFIVAAIAHNSFSPGVIRRMILAGADILRFNFAYAAIPTNIQRIKIAEDIINELNSSIKIMIDLPPRKIRLGDFDLKTFAVRENEEFIFQSASFTLDCNEFIPVQVPKLGEQTYINKTITIGDGEVAIQVIEILSVNAIKARILNNGLLQAMKGFNIEYRVDENLILNHYRAVIEAMAEIYPQYIAVPFVDPSVNEKIKTIFPAGQDSKLIIKIEGIEGMNHIDKILQDPFYSMVLVDRGELGITVPYEKVGIYQKRITELAKQHKKPVIVSTQILESTMDNFIPSRSDVLDVTNMILDGVSGMMLCKETGMGKRPTYSISVAKRIIQAVQNTKISL